MAGIKGTKTEKNILCAFAGESQARNRYTFFASKAKKEGYEQIAAIFSETAANELEHAKLLFKLLEGGEVEITAAFPAGVIGTTAENLKESASGENFEHTKMYPEFAEVAEQEGFKAVAFTFRAIGKVEIEHEKRYKVLQEMVEKGTYFKRDNPIRWRCRNCGHIHEGSEAPETCPLCKHPKAYFEPAE
ncbi:MAG TPA: rubrerythrin family protein [Acidobacteriota bacterium]|jgi:rubrerythrin|nr:rubrerythrin family protein [Acidobacteriota bacterium]HQO19768.1 rubrerythrin family protein [Acidobacteriota bacterium]HQQ46318.1 rubrerythrin family protein [Acidobacteriota bacterium]